MSAASATAAVVPVDLAGQRENAITNARWQPVLGLSCRLTLEIAIPGFRVADFVHLSPGAIVNTNWGIARDVPLRANGILIGWGELEGAGTRLAVRVTELA